MSLYKIEFTQIAIKTVSKYKKSNPVQYKKLVKPLNELMEHPIYAKIVDSKKIEAVNMADKMFEKMESDQE